MLSTDEGSSGEDSDNEEWSNRLESMLAQNKGKKQISLSDKQRMEYEDEEKERRELAKLIHGDATKPGEKKEMSAEEKKSMWNITFV